MLRGLAGKTAISTKPDTEVRSARISFDYMFLMKTGEYGHSEADTGDGGIQILVVKDSKRKAVFAHAVPQKGIDPKRYVVDIIVEDVLWLRWSQVLLKTDNERPIAKLLKQSLAACKVAVLDQVGEEHPPDI